MKETLHSQRGYDAFLFQSKRKDVWRVRSKSMEPVAKAELLFDGVSLFVMKDHDSAGKIWDLAFSTGIINSAMLVHIDAHDDLAFKKPLPATFERLQIEEFQVGSFIIPRIELGIIGEMVWIVPVSMHDSIVRHPSEKIMKEVPQISAQLIDIDLDFFTYKLPAAFPNFLLKLKAKEFLKHTFQCIDGPKIITNIFNSSTVFLGE